MTHEVWQVHLSRSMNEHSIEICFGGIKLSILDDDKSLKKDHLVKNKSFTIINMI